MTAVLAQNCDRVVRLEDQLDYPVNARAIRDSQLDILIYADIGMGIPTYLLAGLRLAPLQVALLGHASTTGLPTVDYFFSSEVEPPQAAAQYQPPQQQQQQSAPRQAPPAPPPAPAAQPAAPRPSAGFDDFGDDDIPF